MKSYFCLGSYTEPILFGTGEIYQGKGLGVSICSFEDGKIEPVSCAPVRNPSFVCMDENRKRIYAVNEMKEFQDAFGGGATALSYNEKGEMQELDSLNVGGTDPCHIVLSPEGTFLSVANFASGSVTRIALDAEGAMDHDRLLFRHEGSSVNPQRQTGPHAHSSIFSPDGKFMYVPDLGIDMVKVYENTGSDLAPRPDLDIHVRPGSGPRYGEFSPDGKHFYLICELGARIEHYRYAGGGRLELCEGLSTLPDDFDGESICADLHLTPDGKYLFGSNRGHDSLISCRVEADGSLTRLGYVPCGGRTPRNFAISPDGNWLLCGNQDSDVICVFSIAGDGSLEQTDEYAAGSPVCIRFFRNEVF